MPKNDFERGQSLVIIAIMLIGMLAMLALVLDGGNLYAQRRKAQNAADAGALAGARNLCITKDSNVAISTANAYALVQNQATGSQASVINNGVYVTATVTFDTFFAHLIGFDQLTAQASAAAACSPPTGGQVLPIAWTCRPPINASVSTSSDCQQQAIDLATLEYYLDHPKTPDGDPTTPDIYPELYIVMNSMAQPDDLSAICESLGGTLDCDFDNDGDDDLLAHGDRSWLDLDGGGGGSSELTTWINDGYPGDILWHTWLGGQSGVQTNVFQAVENHEGDILAIPVFDQICDDLPSTDCPGMVHAQDTIVTSAGGNYYYHIIGFAAFYVDCVETNHHDNCPGHQAAEDLGVIAGNTKTIEGYFVTGYFPNLQGAQNGNAPDLGVYTVRLFR